MISLEQVQLLEAKVARAIEYVQRVTAENLSLASEKDGLQAKLEANQKRIDELEVLIMRFKEDQGRIEDGIIAALDRLSQFEEAFENSLKEKTAGKKAPAKPDAKQAAKTSEKPAEADASQKEVFFEIPEKEAGKSSSLPENASTSETAGELDIF